MDLVDISKAFRFPGSKTPEEHLLRGLKGMRKKGGKKPPRTTMTMGMHFSSPKYKPKRQSPLISTGGKGGRAADDNQTRNIAVGAAGGLGAGALLSRR